jgi:hypothetical protein
MFECSIDRIGEEKKVSFFKFGIIIGRKDSMKKYFNHL